MRAPGWHPGLSQNALSLTSSTRAVASSAGWAQTSGESGAHSHPCACGRGHAARNTQMPGEQPAHTSRLSAHGHFPKCTAGPTMGLGPTAAPSPSSPARWLMEAHPDHAGAHFHLSPPGPSKSKVLKNVLPATQPPHPTSGAGTGPWLAYQARGSRLPPALAAPTKAHGALGPSSRVPPKGEQVPWW